MGLIEINAAIDAICDEFSEVYCNNCDHKSDDGDYCEDCHRKYMNWAASRETVECVLKALPSAQPEPLSDAYMKAVWTWLLNYQIKAAELQGRYTPYEVLSWVVNDWRKEHERSD